MRNVSFREPVRLAPAKDLSIRPPVSFGQPTYRRVWPTIVNAPDWIRDFVATQSGQLVHSREAAVCFYDDALVFDHGMIKVGGHIVQESLINCSLTGQIGPLWLSDEGSGSFDHDADPIREVAEVTILLAQTWDENFGHWLIESLPRIHFALKATSIPTPRIAVYRNAPMQDVYLSSLACFGIAPEQILWLEGTDIRFQTLIYPMPITSQPWIKSPLLVETSEVILAHAERIVPSADRPELLYVSRNAWGRRKLVNEDRVVRMLQARGYRVVSPERYSFVEQVALFSRARCVIGVMGAALSNLVFAPSGVKALMLTNRDMMDDFFLDLVSLRAGEYYSIHGESLQPELGMNSDFTIPVEELETCLATWGF